MPVFLSLVFFSMPELYALGIYLLFKSLTQSYGFLGGESINISRLKSIFWDWNQYFEIEINISRLKSDLKTGVLVPLCIHRITAYLVI